uniref:PREDICTED: similar to SNF2 domaincontaining protein n=1 Tax=Albugo laibachii Nc14 TaxID=890382 RepID=F0WWR7_9STRA|nr:PREDICTED: similar to SNF2 domaincontaining protein [Albugo laibachii Nc14]|eukprot:CCA25894.1 PREDICTED: similar to SNF2 domaincontaining protein [Albugo laibachii Nc14]
MPPKSGRECKRCCVCKMANARVLLCCVECDCEYHLSCINPPLRCRPQRAWKCPHCELPIATSPPPPRIRNTQKPSRLRNTQISESKRVLRPRNKRKREIVDHNDEDIACDSSDSDDPPFHPQRPSRSRYHPSSSSDSSESDIPIASPRPNSTPNPSPPPPRRDSLQLEAESDSIDAEEPYKGPRYFLEYSNNNRSKCKSCDGKLFKDGLRVGVRIRNSLFGLMHLQCTQICSSDPETASFTGLNALSPMDRKLVLDHMLENHSKGLQDEREELQDTDFCIRTRMEEMEPPSTLTATLLPYQREALYWMNAQENSIYRGGILADEMGMGKTVQAISLILRNTRDSNDSNEIIGGTLVVCPLVAVTQWKSEIERFVKRDHLSIYIHHGGKRMESPSKIASYDIVLTTYSILEAEIRSTLSIAKVPCAYCSKSFLPDKLMLHNKYFCGPNAKRTGLQSKQSRKSMEKRSPPPKKANAKAKANKKPLPNLKRSPLHRIHWTRIVLDEAHYIKDRRCNTAKSVFLLNASYRWCLTGTPLQNRIGELFSLIRFLRIDKFAYYHCTQCACQLLDFTMDAGKCVECSHSALMHYSYFNKKIVIPIQAFGYVAEGKLALLRLQNEILHHILLRRTKVSRADDICLPPKLIRVRRDAMDDRENDFYQAIYTQSRAQFDTYVSSGTLLNNYAHIFDLLMRLRQAVDHPYLVIYSKSNPAITSNASTSSVCGFCHEQAENSVVSSCTHTFCRECVKMYLESLMMDAVATCPTCDSPLTVDINAPARPIFKKKSILSRIDTTSFQTSTKIEALFQELDMMKTRDPSGKAIVFSQFVNMLDLIQFRLKLGGIPCVTLSGNMSMDARDRILESFRSDVNVTTLLISLKAGGVALNLTIASHIFLMDPWWNPAAESQAIDRTHRLGQFKPIQATHFIIAGSIEDRILQLQDKKRLIFDATVGGNVGSLTRLTIEDLRFLFSK